MFDFNTQQLANFLLGAGLDGVIYLKAELLTAAIKKHYPQGIEVFEYKHHRDDLGTAVDVLREFGVVDGEVVGFINTTTLGEFELFRHSRPVKLVQYPALAQLEEMQAMINGKGEIVTDTIPSRAEGRTPRRTVGNAARKFLRQTIYNIEEAVSAAREVYPSVRTFKPLEVGKVYYLDARDHREPSASVEFAKSCVVLMQGTPWIDSSGAVVDCYVDGDFGREHRKAMHSHDLMTFMEATLSMEDSDDRRDSCGREQGYGPTLTRVLDRMKVNAGQHRH